MIFPLRVFGRASAKRMSSGLAIGPIIFYVGSKTVLERSLGLNLCGTSRTLRRPDLSIVGSADDRRLGHRFMGDERVLDFGGSEPMSCHAQDVVDATEIQKYPSLSRRARSPVK